MPQPGQTSPSHALWKIKGLQFNLESLVACPTFLHFALNLSILVDGKTIQKNKQEIKDLSFVYLRLSCLLSLSLS